MPLLNYSEMSDVDALRECLRRHHWRACFKAHARGDAKYAKWHRAVAEELTKLQRGGKR